MDLTKTCSVCGAKGVYARGMCTKCYTRTRLNGGVVTPTLQQAQRIKWCGMRRGDWTIVEPLPKQKALIRCEKCGRTRIISRQNFEKSGYRKCICEVEHLEPKTETQARVYKALLHNKGNASKAGAELGMSRQAVWAVLNTMKKRGEHGDIEQNL